MPEISPELAARIETLKASHAENPARFFMPLASAWREAGETAKAEELLRENLKRHPGYLSAHVLLGRCLADRGAYAEARNEFQYVLSVDPQNLIALRTLGDMAAQGGDGAEARRWYDELLHVDPMNAEARAALAALDAAPPAPAAQPETARPASGHDAFGMVEIAQGDAHEPDHPAAHADPGSWGELSLDEPALASPAPEAHEEPAPSAAGGFDTLDFGTVDIDAQPAEAEAAEPPAAGPAEPASASGGGFDMWGSVDDGQDDVEPGVEPLPLETYYEPEAEPPAAEAHDDHDEHGEVVTETIAELYARQGLPDRAADVYRQLIARRGEEPALVRRLEELEREMAAGSTAPADETAAGFQDLDLPAFATAAPSSAAPSSLDSHAPAHEEPASAAWLETVDHVVAGTYAAGASQAEPAGAAIDLPAFATAHDPAGTGDAFADSFAYGFAGAPAAAAVSEAAPEDQGDGRAEWEAPRVEETGPAPELAGAAAFAATIEDAPPASSDAGDAPASMHAGVEVPASIDAGGDIPPSTVAEGVDASASAAGTGDAVPAAEPGHGAHTIAAYLTAILAWRPGASVAPAAQPEVPAAGEAAPSPVAAPEPVDEAAPPPERPWDQETLGAAVEQPPMDEPWIAGGPAVADRPDQGDEPWAAEHPLDAAPAAEPWAEPAAGEAEEPWAAGPAADEVPAVEAPTPEADQWGLTPEQVPPGVGAEPADEGEGEDLPWLSTEAEPAAGTEPAATSQAPSEEPMPWESGFELSPEVPEEPAAERAAPRQEPTVEPAGGFSFEDFFAERSEEPQPLPEPVPPPPPAPVEAVAPPPPPAQPAPPQQGGEEDEDLESFQAWLQSLKR